MTIRGVLFDIDGTLLDTDAGRSIGMVVALQEAGVPAEDARRGVDIWQADPGGHYDAYAAGTLTFPEQRLRRLTDLFTELSLPVLDDAGATEWLATYVAAQLRVTTAYDDVSPGLAACAGLRVGALSNNDGHWQRDRIELVGLTGHFSVILGIDDVSASKPDPAAFLAGCAALDLEPHQVAYVGNHLDVDARGALAAGLHGVWLDRDGDEDYDLEGVARIGSLIELAALLPELPGLSSVARSPAEEGDFGARGASGTV